MPTGKTPCVSCTGWHIHTDWHPLLPFPRPHDPTNIFSWSLPKERRTKQTHELGRQRTRLIDYRQKKNHSPEFSLMRYLRATKGEENKKCALMNTHPEKIGEPSSKIRKPQDNWMAPGKNHVTAISTEIFKYVRIHPNFTSRPVWCEKMFLCCFSLKAGREKTWQTGLKFSLPTPTPLFLAV